MRIIFHGGWRLVAVVTAIGLVIGLAGCGENTKAKSSAELSQALTQVAADAQAACDATDVGAADGALKKATEQVAELTGLAQPTAADTPADPAAQAVMPTAQATLASVQELAALTHEKKTRDDRINSLTAWTYRQSRNLAVKGLVSGMAFAAGQAQAKGLATLPQAVQDLANQAAELAACPPLPDGTTDWQAVKVKLDGWAATPPPELALILSVGWLALRQKDLALVEIEMANIPLAPPSIPAAAPTQAIAPTPEAAIRRWLEAPQAFDKWRLLMRALIYRENDLPRLAAKEEAKFEQLCNVAGSGQGVDSTAYLQLILHGYRCSVALKERDLEAADGELAELLRYSPDSPFTVLLTGERQLASGNPGQAANGLETWLTDHAKDPESAWWVATLQSRARAVRDSAGDGKPVPPFLLDVDFLAAVGEHLHAGSASPAEAAGDFGGAAIQALDQGQLLVRRLQPPVNGETEVVTPDASPAVSSPPGLAPVPAASSPQQP